MRPKDVDGMANSADPDQIAPIGSALFATLSQNLGFLWYNFFFTGPQAAAVYMIRNSRKIKDFFFYINKPTKNDHNMRGTNKLQTPIL